jgi:hypothetical protein
MYTITCKHQLCKTFFCFGVKKGSRFQSWQKDFMHMHPRNWPQTSTASNFALHLWFLEVHDCCHWKECCWYGRITPPPMVYNCRLNHRLIFDQLPVLVVLVRIRSGCPGSWLLFVGLFLFDTSCCCTQIDLCPNDPISGFLLSRSITESQNQMKQNGSRYVVGGGVKTYILEWHDVYLVLSQGWQKMSVQVVVKQKQRSCCNMVFGSKLLINSCCCTNEVSCLSSAPCSKT